MRPLVVAVVALCGLACAEHHMPSEPVPDAGQDPEVGYPSCLSTPNVVESCFGRERLGRDGDAHINSSDLQPVDGSATIAGCACMFECTGVPCPGSAPGGVMPECVGVGPGSRCVFPCTTDADCPDAWRCVQSTGSLPDYCVEVKP